MVQELFFQLIQVALGNRTKLSSAPNAEDWEHLYQMALEQALTGIAFSGIEKLPTEQLPPLSLACAWQEEAQTIEKENRQHLKRANQLLNHLHKDGFKAIILKGMSNIPNYPQDLKLRRCAGDIDVWLWPQTSQNTSKTIKETIKYCLSLIPNQFVCYIHIDFPVFSDIPVEAHFRPSFLCNPIYNSRLQKWFESQKSVLDNNASVLLDAVQTDMNYIRFHAVYQLLHIYKHLFEEGIGLRQLLDYHCLCQKYKEQISNDPEFIPLMNYFGLKQFFYTVQWVNQRVFECEPTCPTDTTMIKHGEFLLSEILKGGNFGQYDKRIKHGGDSTRHALEKLKHNLRLFSHYPSEVLWEPIFRIYHFFWRQAMKISLS